MDFLDVLFRALHVLFGITWIGLLYYFNFVQTEYFKVSEPSAKSDVVQKLVPNALWYFRYAALFTFLNFNVPECDWFVTFLPTHLIVLESKLKLDWANAKDVTIISSNDNNAFVFIFIFLLKQYY